MSASPDFLYHLIEIKDELKLVTAKGQESLFVQIGDRHCLNTTIQSDLMDILDDTFRSAIKSFYCKKLKNYSKPHSEACTGYIMSSILMDNSCYENIVQQNALFLSLYEKYYSNTITNKRSS